MIDDMIKVEEENDFSVVLSDEIITEEMIHDNHNYRLQNNKEETIITNNEIKNKDNNNNNNNLKNDDLHFKEVLYITEYIDTTCVCVCVFFFICV